MTQTILALDLSTAQGSIELPVNLAANEEVQEFFREKIRATVTDPTVTSKRFGRVRVTVQP